MVYRLYVITASGKRNAPVDVDCLSDVEASRLAETMVNPDRLIEVWNGPRLVELVGRLRLQGQAAL